MSGPEKTVLIVAGEASGDLHGANLVKAMRVQDASLKFVGVGGKRMAEAGVSLIASASDMAVVGLTEVFHKLGTIRRVMAALKTFLKRERPTLVILIDYPDFNLRLARVAHKLGLRVFYFISPQVWAWRKGRIKSIRRDVDRMAVILPFEEAMYRQSGVDATFVGHPLLDAVKTSCSREEFLQRFNLDPAHKVLALLPGSRHGEVEKLLPVMLEAGRLLREKIPTLQFLLPLADTLSVRDVAPAVRASGLPVRIVEDAGYEAIAAADAAVVTSGTATLETALLGTPMVIVYKMSPLSYYLGKQFIRVSHIGLANIIAGKTIVPELIQDDANPKRLSIELARLLLEEDASRSIREELSKIKEKLGKPGASQRTAELACATFA